VGVRHSARAKYCLLGAWVLVCLSAVLSLLIPHSYRLTALGDFSQVILLLAAVLAMAANVKSGDRQARLFWGLMTLGCGMWLSVQALWTYFEVFLHREVPNPFIGDVVLFLHLVPMMGALAMQPHVDREEHSTRLGALDFTLLLIWWLYLYLFAVIPWQYVSPNATLYGHSFDVLYLMEHLVFLAMAGFVWLRSVGDSKIIFGHLLGAGALYAFSSIAASVAIDFGHYYTGSFYDVPLVACMAWFFGLGLVGNHLPFRTAPIKEGEGKRDVWGARLATGAVLSLPVLAGWSEYMSHAPGRVQSFRMMLTLCGMMLMGGLLALKQYRLDKELAHANQELREASLTDLLTGAKNRRFLTTTIEGDVRHVIRAYSPNSGCASVRNRDLIFYLIDADHFKEVNDRYGHDLGDGVLVQIARRISSAIRHSDVLIRWGGEEFLVVSRYTNRDEAAALAARVLNAVGSEKYELQGGQKIGRTCSIGWAVFPWIVRDPEAVSYGDVLRVADRALYEAKKAGRNQSIGMLPLTETLPVLPPFEEKGQSIMEVLPVRTVVTLGPSASNQEAAAAAAPAKAMAATQDA